MLRCDSARLIPFGVCPVSVPDVERRRKGFVKSIQGHFHMGSGGMRT